MAKQSRAKGSALGASAGKPGSGATFEEAMENLESSVRKLEEGVLGLDDSLRVFEEGIQWSRQCHQRLADAEKKVEILLKADKEELTQVSFDLEGGEGSG